MKKISPLILILTSLFLCSCKTNAPTSTTAPTQSTTSITEESTALETTTPEIIVTQQPLTAVSLPVYRETTKAEDGTVIFIHQGQTMSLILEDPDVANKIIVDFLNRTDTQSSDQAYAEQAAEMYKAGNTTFPLWTLSNFESKRLDRNILSLYGCKAEYTAGVHANYAFNAVTYDLATGEVLTLANILEDNVALSSLRELILNSLKSEEESGKLFPDYAQTVTSLLDRDPADYSNWYLSDSGLCFFYSPYDIGPFASFDIVATIPYASLTGILRDPFFPPETDISNGNLCFTDFEKANLDDFTQYAELILNPDGKKIILYTDTRIDDIVITAQIPSVSDASSAASLPVFAADCLTPGDAIMVQMPADGDISVAYTSGGVQHTHEISN